MLYCCTYYTWAIFLGTVYATGSLLIFVCGIIAFIQLENLDENSERVEDLKYATIELTTICGVTALISFLFILAIYTRCKYLIIPWLFINIYNLFMTCKISCKCFMDATRDGSCNFYLFTLFIAILIILGIETLILYFSFSLFCYMRAEKTEKEKARLLDEEDEEEETS